MKNNDITALLTFNGKNLYTSIVHNYELKAISFWIEKYPDSLHYTFSKGFVLGNTKIVLENNNGTFNDDFYGQISGTATSTIFTPTYAILTMGYFDVHFHKWNGEKKFKNLSSRFGVAFCHCQTPLDKNKVKPDKLLETLNSANEDIQFTM